MSKLQSDFIEKRILESETNALPICDSKLMIIYKHNKPYGIRDRGGFLFFFADISKYTDQEDRYRGEIEQQFKLADFLLKSLKETIKKE